MKEIYFIRHGETDWNKQGKTQGMKADIELNQYGILQSEKTGEYLNKYRNNPTFDMIVCSPLKRTYATACAIAEQIGYDPAQIIQKDELKEVDKGKMTGLTKNDNIMKEFYEIVKRKYDEMSDPIEKYETCSPFSDFFPTIAQELSTKLSTKLDEEAPSSLINRIQKFIEFLKETDKRKIIVVSHSGLLEVMFQLIFHMNVIPQGQFASKSKNCYISFCKLSGNGIFHMISPPNTEHLYEDV